MIMKFPPLITQELSFAYAVLQDRRKKPLIPHWVAYVNSGFSVVYCFSIGVPMVKRGAFAYNGALGFWVPAVAGAANYVLIPVYLYKAVEINDLPADGGSHGVDVTEIEN